MGWNREPSPVSLFTCSAIAAGLNAEGVPGVSGEPKWLRVTIEAMLKNEKYMGDSLLQKTYTADFLTKKQVKNEGEVIQYYVKDSHECCPYVNTMNPLGKPVISAFLRCKPLHPLLILCS